MPFQNIQVIFTLTRKNNLFQFFGIFNLYGGIFKIHPLQGFTQFFIIAFAQWF